ncbi:hypothetical protein PYW08_003425 [Mythimna loreyi]|uniref:Uncharacterized protein n=1 Tax=Mythimna loreyi TaxID=667449 RepID=A0ACC2QRQ5_9NEOP|nr:hypothetical protein PYW08_003425 [Mythimna loreyi]
MKILWLLWLFVVLPTVVLGQTFFGRSYLKNSRLCHHWNCISTKLGLPDSLPSREESEVIFRRVLPEGPWQDVIANVLDNCYENRARRFTNTCPGQALLHCVVDQMIDFCPVSSTRQNDSCSPVSSLAGLKYMFSQSRYINLEKNLPRERRPTWFLKNYFDSKCCDLPVIFNTTVLEECGFSSFINYYDHGPKYTDVQAIENQGTTAPTTPVFMPFDIPDNTTPAPDTTTTEYADVSRRRLPEYDFSGTPVDISSDEPTDPLDCCEMTNFINPSWRSECDFHLSFKGQERLVISSHGPATEISTTTTTTERTNRVEDLMVVPHSCQKETCVFQLMGIISDTGILDIDAYIKMLDNFTDTNPAWTKAKARVLTKCVAKPVRSYEAGCEINNMLACTLDVLTENCPYKRKSNICKHGKYDVSCQISSSKYRPKNRREICLLPELIHRSHLQECGLESLYKVEHVPVPSKTRKHGWLSSYTCKDSKQPTTCMISKMGVMNKYNFMDYFKMKDRIRKFTSDQAEWSALLDIYMSAFINMPLYTDHCNSEKKLLNVIDTMLMTCPVSKRKNTAQCNKIFQDITNTAPNNQNVTKEKLDEIMKHYHHVFMPNQPETTNLHRAVRKKHSRIVKKPVYNFAFLNSQDAPPVRVISLTPEVTTKRPLPPLVLRPVYLRPEFGQGGPVNDGVFRGGLWNVVRPVNVTNSPFRTPLLYSFGSGTYSPTTPVYKATTEFSIVNETTAA